MDLIILIALATTFLLLLLTLYFFKKQSEKANERENQIRRGKVGVVPNNQQDVPRRAQIIRNQRNRLRQQHAASVSVTNAEADAQSTNRNDDEVELNGEFSRHSSFPDEKIGAKKRAKLEAKEQKRAARDQELQQRERQKALEAKREEERKEQEEREAEEERQRLEAERLAREAQIRREEEEYLKLKSTFSVEEEGCDEPNADESQNLLAIFVEYIKNNKVVILEDIAAEFKMKTPDVIKRIQDLKESGILTGVIDDCGKFIYISEDELYAVAKFIKNRGRVSIAELAESSNNLINLTPITTTN